jgi:hypothetical protein
VVAVEAPTTLPVDHLSLSSLRLYQQCPERWRRRYLEREYEPPSGKMILGSAAGAAEAQSYAQKIEDGEGYTVEQVCDEFDAEFEDRIHREEIDWGSDRPGELKDSGVEALALYHRMVVPEVVPVSVERQFDLSWPGLDWNVIGYIDVEDADGAVRDMKMRGKRMSQKDADADLQPTLYLAARRAEGNPASAFRFDTMVRSSKPVAEVVSTPRTDSQLDMMSARIFAVAREIDWRISTGNWIGAAPGTWFCSTCSYDCPWRLG